MLSDNMRQATAFLDIRIRQAAREVLRAGPVYGMLLILGIAAAFLFFYFAQKSNQFIVYAYSGLLLLILTIHLQRNDHRFIRLFGVKPYAIFLFEYSAVLLPFFVLTFIKSGQIFQVLSILPVVLIALMKVKNFTVDTGKFPVFFTGSGNFEWKAGLRKTGWMLSFLWLGALLLAPVPYASLLPLWFMLLLISSFYEAGESRSMVEAFEVSEKQFLWMKIRDQSLLFCSIVLPVLIVSAWFFPGNWWISLFFISYGILNIAVFVVSKYAVWGPGESHGSVTFMNTFCLVGFFLPFLLPLPVFVLIRNYFKARNHLKPLLHAYAK